MDADELKRLLGQFQQGKLSKQAVVDALRSSPYKQLASARLDLHRHLRTGIPEVVLCEGKSQPQILAIVAGMVKAGHPVLATRLDAKIAATIKRRFPRSRYHSISRVLTLAGSKSARSAGIGCVCVVTAGTSDIPVAEEARDTLEFLGARVETIYDAGVAGLHRFLGEERKLREAQVVIAVAGMEGALPSVLGGLSGKPIIAVPTSTGYGAAFGGISALLAMLNACSSGITVVNIDNGFGAACAAYRILTAARDSRESSDL